MPPFKVVLVDFNGLDLPDWVAPELAQAGIDFAARQCDTPTELAQHAADADVVWLWGSRVISAEGLRALPRCGAIIRTGSGTDNVPILAASELGIVVANTPEAHSHSVSDHAIGLLFAVTRHIRVLDQSLRAGEWRSLLSWPGWHLHGRTLGLVGFGHAARLVARKLSGFELIRLAYDPFVSAEAMAAEGVRAATLDEVLTASDFVSLHCPLTPATFHLIGEAQLRQMKPLAILINTARGPVVDEPALVRALTEGWIAAAGLDVFEEEPPHLGNPLFKLDNVIVTPHVAGQSDEAFGLGWRLAVASAIALAHGRWPRSVVNPQVKPRWPLT